MELVNFVGLQDLGKSTFFRDRFEATHELVSKHQLSNPWSPFRLVRQGYERTGWYGNQAIEKGVNLR